MNVGFLERVPVVSFFLLRVLFAEINYTTSPRQNLFLFFTSAS